MGTNSNPDKSSLFRLEKALIFAVYVVAVVVLTTAAETIMAHTIVSANILPFYLIADAGSLRATVDDNVTTPGGSSGTSASASAASSPISMQ